MELMNVINDAGIPPGVVNLLSGDPEEVSNELISSNIVKKGFDYWIYKSRKNNS